MPSALFLSFNTACNLGFRRALNVNQSHSIRLHPHISYENCHGTLLPTGIGLRIPSFEKAMSVSRPIIASGDAIVNGLVTGFGDVCNSVKAGGVSVTDRSSMLCRKAVIGIRNADGGSCGGRGSNIYNSNTWCGFSKGLNHNQSFSSSCHSDGTVPKVSSDGSSVVEHLSNLAVSTEERIPTQNMRLKLLSGACYMPHPAKEETGGEDAHFICIDEQVIGVADGVGGWADVGVNAGEYARELMNKSVEAIRESVDGDVDPLKVLEKAHSSTNAMGSSTACIIALKNEGIHAINLGDSGFIIVRDGRTIFESPVQQHGFNFTYQLERSDRGDLPSSGQVFKIPVSPGDVIVAGSDGLFDNLYSKEIAGIVGDAVREGLSPDATAQKIAEVARARALDNKYQSPFAVAAQQAGYIYFGGKLDDLTVLVSYVSAPTDA